eukprot:INCI2651.3.p1 GENE.INCI2651.3~~INCI2651.3.p1  ORF type:complete len:928 (+),score=136.14 INCI2651.3:177-2960(+)
MATKPTGTCASSTSPVDSAAHATSATSPTLSASAAPSSHAASRATPSEQPRGARSLKILSFNINGLKSVCDFYGGLAKLLEKLDSDIVCFQETKVNRSSLTQELACCPGYRGFFSFCRRNAGGSTTRSRAYSGTATFVKESAAVTVVAAQDGITALLDNHGDTIVQATGGDDDEEDVGAGSVDRNGDGDSQSLAFWDADLLQELDSEGRCVVTDHGAFVLFNVYAPAYSETEGRVKFKKRYHSLLLDSIQQLHANGRKVVLLGDLNCAASMIDRDNCSTGGGASRNRTPAEIAADFHDSFATQWLQRLMDPRQATHDHLVDSFRAKFPRRTGAYTCWMTKSGARETNYGSRIDYVLCSSRLLQSPHKFKPATSAALVSDDTARASKKSRKALVALLEADILPDVQGSDHCPTFCTVQLPDHQKNVPLPMKEFSSPLLFSAKGTQRRLNFAVVPKDAHITVPTTTSKTQTTENSKAGGVSVRKTKALTSFLKAKPKKPRIDSFFTSAKRKSPGIKPALSTPKAPSPGNDRDGAPAAIRSLAPKAAGAWSALMRGPRKMPLCAGHQLPCVQRTVLKEGENKGKKFFCCPKPDGRRGDPAARCQSFFWETELNWDGTLKKRTSQSESAAKSPLSPVNNDGVPMIAQRLIENAATHFGKAGTCTVLQPGDPPSWVVVFRAFCRVDAAEAKCQWDVGQALTKTQIHLRGGATAFENRKNRFYSADPSIAGFKYSGRMHPAHPANSFQKRFVDIANKLFQQQGVNTSGKGPQTSATPYAVVLQNWYEPQHTIGLHADDETEHLRGLPIFSFSLGGTRRFVIRSKAGRTISMDLKLKDGDLIVMGGNLQRTHEHEVPPIRKRDPFTGRTPALPGRMNLTVRAFASGAGQPRRQHSNAKLTSSSQSLSEAQRQRIQENKRKALERKRLRAAGLQK